MTDFNIKDLRVSDLRGADLSGLDLYGVDFFCVDLSNTNFTGANLRYANFSQANLRSANFSRANLYGANLREAYLRNVSIVNIDLSYVNLTSADLTNAQLSNVNLHYAYTLNANFKGAILDREKLTKSPIQIHHLDWPVLITEGYMRIGCQRHTHKEWENFSDEAIAAMSHYALGFWHRWKNNLLDMCKIHAELAQQENIVYNSMKGNNKELRV